MLFFYAVHFIIPFWLILGLTKRKKVEKTVEIGKKVKKRMLRTRDFNALFYGYDSSLKLLSYQVQF